MEGAPCEKGCKTRKEIAEHLAEPHYIEDCPHMELCPAHWDESTAGRVARRLFMQLFEPDE